MVYRRQALALAGAGSLWLAAGLSLAHAAEKTIDRRLRSEARQYGLTFAAEAPTDAVPTGHAFIIWQHEDDNANMSVAEAIGFYPVDGDATAFDLIFGTDGGLLSDSQTNIDVKLTVLLNADQYQAALDAKRAWQSDGTYRAFWRNCTTHVAAIASTIGLTTSGGTWEHPLDYVNDLVANNN